MNCRTHTHELVVVSPDAPNTAFNFVPTATADTIDSYSEVFGCKANGISDQAQTGNKLYMVLD